MQRIVVPLVSGWLLAGCVGSAVITESAQDRVFIRAERASRAQVMAEAERGCGFYGRAAVEAGKRCLDASCSQQLIEFSCQGRAEYTGSRAGPWLGLSVDDIADHIYAEPPGTPEVVIRRVFVDGPADRAGLAVGDIVETFNGVAVSDAAMLADLKRSVAVGDQVRLGVRRGRERMQASIAAESWR